MDLEPMEDGAKSLETITVFLPVEKDVVGFLCAELQLAKQNTMDAVKR
jgi:hypothetical protein